MVDTTKKTGSGESPGQANESPDFPPVIPGAGFGNADRNHPGAPGAQPPTKAEMQSTSGQTSKDTGSASSRKEALQLAIQHHAGGQARIEGILETAERFHAYLKDGLPVVDPKASPPV